MSDRTHQYRQLSRRDPATTAELYTRDGDGNPIPVAHSVDGKLVVEVSGGGGGGGGVIQAKAPGANPTDPRVTVDLYATTDSELLVSPKPNSPVALRGLVPATISPPAAPYLIDLKADDQGALAVSIDAPVALEAVLSGSFPASKVPLVADVNGSLQVAIEASVTVPVEVQGVAEVKATSTSVWNFGKVNGAFTHPDVTDADGWMDLRAFSRLSATAIASGYTYDLAEGFLSYGSATVHKVATGADPVANWNALQAAINGAASGDVILLRNGSYTMPSTSPVVPLLINKPLTLIGESRENVIVQSPPTDPGTTAFGTSTTIVSIASSGVTMASMTIRYQWNRSLPNAEVCILAENTTNNRYDAVRLENLRIEFIEEGIRARLSNSRIANCELVYVGWPDLTPGSSTSGNTHRPIRLRSLAGQFELLDCVFNTPATVVGNNRCIWYDRATGDTFSGHQIIARNTQALGSKVFQFFEMPGQPTVLAGECHMEFRDNTVREENGFVIFSSVTTGTMNFLTSITLENNDIANGALGNTTGKGFVAIDAGSGTTLRVVRDSALPLFASGNVAVNPDPRTTYYGLAGILVVATTSSTAPFTVDVFTDVPESTAPAATGSNLLIYWSGNLQVQYKVVDAEPVGQTLSTTAINGTYHAIIDPTDPQDILGIGRVRLVASGSTDLGGYYAAFAVAK